MSILDRFRKYQFRISHLVWLFTILAIFQVGLSIFHSKSKNDLLNQTMNTYRRDIVERTADLTSSSLEMLLEQTMSVPPKTELDRTNLIQKFNILLSQHSLQKNVNEFGIITEHMKEHHIIDSGESLYNFFFNNIVPPNKSNETSILIDWYYEHVKEFKASEKIFSEIVEHNLVNVYVPLVLYGEYSGVIYLQISPDLKNISNELEFSFDISGAMFTAIILFGMLGMFYISSYSVQERDNYQNRLLEEQEKILREQIERQKEAIFTSRIYHAHHKAEKIMGFIKEDLKNLTKSNIKTIKSRVEKYSNFVGRVIYDMKSIDPPMTVIRGDAFSSDLNEIIKFIVSNIFERVYGKKFNYKIELELDNNIQQVSVNEYVIWQILEPIIQNSIDHNYNDNLIITIRTRINKSQQTVIEITDNGTGINDELLRYDRHGKQIIFKEESTTKSDDERSGYGCYIAFENCKRCGWEITANNSDTSGAKFSILIRN